jgi:glycine C-acetyltransferase/8-amino-7-oxononanoate synthase
MDSETEAWIPRALDALRAEGLERRLERMPATGAVLTVGRRRLLNFSSNDYLALACHPAVTAGACRAIQEYGCGATASRLLVGTLPCHAELEERLAGLKHYPAALVFGSGYLANAGLVPAIVGRGDHVVLDRLAHASLVDAAILSQARLHRFRHNDAGHLDEILGRLVGGRNRRLVATESVFSMDGDLAPLADLAAVARRRDAMLLVDEAHAMGVFGPAGSGRVRQLGLEPSVNLSMGTLSKAVGSYGGFVGCSTAMRDWLVNRARAFVYSTALPPPAAGAALAALTLIEQNPAWGEELLARAEAFRRQLREAGLDTGGSASQIVPVVVGDTERVLRLSRRLRERGIWALAIRPPTVPRGTARLRFSVTRAHSLADLETAARVLGEEIRQEGSG